MNSYDVKCRKLREILQTYAEHDVAVAFSGGADSSLLLKMACECAEKTGKKVYAVTIHTRLHPAADLPLTKKLAEKMGAVHLVLEADELAEAGIKNNPKNRCYLCKKYMFTKILSEASARNVPVVIDGTNMDDTKEYRPGLQALRELGIQSPLLLAELTKAEVRRLAGEYHISVADRPSAPCLATRFPYDTTLSYEELRKADEIEEQIRAMEYGNVRARIQDKTVRIEVDADAISELLEQRERLIPMIKERGYYYVSVDLEGFRSGSQDIGLV